MLLRERKVPVRSGLRSLVPFLRDVGVGQEGKSALAGAVHHLLILGNGLQFIGDVGQVGGTAILHRVLEGLQFGIKAEAVVANLNVEAAAFFEGKGDGAELVDDALEGGVAGPDEGAGTTAVGSGVSQGLVAGEGEVGLGGGAVCGEKTVGAGVSEQVGAEGVVELDGTVDRRGEDAIARVRDATWLGGKVASAGFVDGDGVVGGLKLRVTEGKDDAGRCLGLSRSHEWSDGRNDEQQEGSRVFHG